MPQPKTTHRTLKRHAIRPLPRRRRMIIQPTNLIHVLPLSNKPRRRSAPLKGFPSQYCSFRKIIYPKEVSTDGNNLQPPKTWWKGEWWVRKDHLRPAAHPLPAGDSIGKRVFRLRNSSRKRCLCLGSYCRHSWYRSRRWCSCWRVCWHRCRWSLGMRVCWLGSGGWGEGGERVGGGVLSLCVE